MSLLSCEELYDRFVRNLEPQHRGEFVAVHIDGRVIVDKNDIEVVDRPCLNRVLTGPWGP